MPKSSRRTLDPSVASGYPPLVDVLQGREQWLLTDAPTGYSITLFGTDVQTTVGSFTNDDEPVSDGFEGLPTVGDQIPLPAVRSEIDLANFGGGFENEWSNIFDGVSGHTITDTLITPFGDYTLPLGSTVTETADLLSSIESTNSAGERWFSLAETAFANGNYSVGLTTRWPGSTI